MDWQTILSGMSAERLRCLAASAGIERASSAKKSLVRALLEHLDESLKIEALGQLGIERLRELASDSPNHLTARKHELITSLLANGAAEDEQRDEEDQLLAELLVPDRGRRDLPEGHNVETAIEMLPCRPTGRTEGADVTLALEVQQLLRRPGLRRAVIVVPSAASTLLGRLVTSDLDDLIESVVRHVEAGRDERAPLTFILDGNLNALAETASGRTLVAIARALRGVVEIRLTPKDHRLQAQLLAFEEERAEGAFLTAMVGGGALPDALDGIAAKSIVEASLRIAGPIGSSSPPCSLIREWVMQLMRDARSLTGRQLHDFPADESVLRKVAYKRHFDTAHELALKHLAEQIGRRGRHACPLFDPTSLEPPPRHQLLGSLLSTRPHQPGVVLADGPGAGKTVQAGLILARELRRGRVLASEETTERRRALIVAPTSLHGHWREELTAKVGLEVKVHRAAESAADAAFGAQVLICGPATLRESWEDFQGVSVLVLDEALLYGEETLDAVRRLRRTVDQCVVLSSVPVIDEPLDLLMMADLACPDDGFRELADVLEDDVVFQQLGEELRGICARTVALPDSAKRTRTCEDRPYTFDEAEVEAYEELRRMRSDYAARGHHEHSGAFEALERAFLSSAQAFAAAASAVLIESAASDLFVLDEGDQTLNFLRSSGYFKRRIRRLRDRLGVRIGPSAPLCTKEATLLAILADCKRMPVVLITQYRTTAARLSTVLARAKIAGPVELIDEASTLRERLGIVARFRKRCEARKVADGPSGVLVCTDRSAEELTLQKAAHVLINFDLPWNPQRIERRIGRLSRWGQADDVRVFNLVAVHPERAMWTMDSRIAYACRELFGMAEGTASQALYEVEPKVLQHRLTTDGAPELSLIEEPDDEVVAEVDTWLSAADSPVTDAALDDAVAADSAMRTQLAEFWARISHRRGALAGARGHLFARLRQGLLQGMVGLLCAPDRTVDECEDWHLVVGLRVLVESAPIEAGLEPWADATDDIWLVEDEVVHLWAVSPTGELMDWAEFLLAEGLTEVPSDDAARLVDREVIDFLLKEKGELEKRQLDAVPLAHWIDRAPAALQDKLEIVAEHAVAMAEVRHAEVETAWAEAKDERLVRFDARRGAVEGDEAATAATEAALARAHAEDVTIRHEVLGTQLFVVTH